MTFLDEVEDFISRTGTSPSRIGRDVLNDAGFVTRLRAGRSCQENTMEMVRDYMNGGGNVEDQSECQDSQNA